MGRRSYPQALDAVLRPLGFTRHGDDWIRVRGDIEDCVNRQSRWIGGVTVNLFQKDLETEKLYREIMGPDEPLLFCGSQARIGTLVYGYDRWWTTDDPNGPDEVARLVVEHGMAWFDRVRTLEDQAVSWYHRDALLSSERSYGKYNILLAITLYRMGRYDEACRVVRHPQPRTAIRSVVSAMNRVRQWLDRHPPS
jgi:hypothetical protein